MPLSRWWARLNTMHTCDYLTETFPLLAPQGVVAFSSSFDSLGMPKIRPRGQADEKPQEETPTVVDETPVRRPWLIFAHNSVYHFVHGDV